MEVAGMPVRSEIYLILDDAELGKGSAKFSWYIQIMKPRSGTSFIFPCLE